MIVLRGKDHHAVRFEPIFGRVPNQFSVRDTAESVVDAESISKLLELVDIFFAGRMHVLSFRDESHVLDTLNTVASKHFFELSVVLTVDDDQFVFVQLNFHRTLWIKNRDAAAAVVQQQIFEVVQHALQHRHVDGFAIQVFVRHRTTVVACFQNNVGLFAKRIK